MRGETVRQGVILESVATRVVTLGIGSLLMLAPITGVWWAFAGTFLVGFLAHLGFEIFGVNQTFCERVMSS